MRYLFLIPAGYAVVAHMTPPTGADVALCGWTPRAGLYSVETNPGRRTVCIRCRGAAERAEDLTTSH